MFIGDSQTRVVLLEDENLIKSYIGKKYLGFKLTQDGTVNNAVKKRNTQGKIAVTLMNSYIWDEKLS